VVFKFYVSKGSKDGAKLKLHLRGHLLQLWLPKLLTKD